MKRLFTIALWLACPIFGYAQNPTLWTRPGEIAKCTFMVDTIATADEGGSANNLQELSSGDLGIIPFYADDLDNETAVQILGYYLDADGNPDRAFAGHGIYNLVHDADLTDNGGTIVAAHFSWDSDRTANDAFWVLEEGPVDWQRVNVRTFGATGDGSTDDTAAIQSAIDTGRTVYFPNPGVNYNVVTIYPRDQQTLYGESKWHTHIEGRIQLGNGIDSSVREITLRNLKITNTDGNTVLVTESPDYIIKECYIEATGGGDALFIELGYRGAIRDCKIRASGGGWAVTVTRTSNGTVVDHNVVTGGASPDGGAIRVEQTANCIVSNNIVESSYNGIWAASTPHSELPSAGVVSALVMQGNYVEQSATPYRLGTVSIIRGGFVTGNSVFNTQQTIISDRTSAIGFGRLQGVRISNNRIDVAEDGSEDVFEIVMERAPNDAERNVVCDNWVLGTPANVYQSSGVYAANASIRRELGARNRFDFANAYESIGLEGLRTWVSGVIDTSVSRPESTWLPASLVDFGGKVFSVEIIEHDGGSLSGSALKLGRKGDIDNTVDIPDLGALSLSDGLAEVPLVTSSATINATENNLFSVTGTASGKFRLRIRYRAN